MTQIISLWSIASHYFYPAAAAFFSAMGSVLWLSILQVLLLPDSILLPISAGNRCSYKLLSSSFLYVELLIYHLPTSWLCTSKCLSRPSAYYCFIGNTFDNIISFYVYSICSIADAGVPHGLAFASFNEEVLVSISGHDNDDNNNNDD